MDAAQKPAKTRRRDPISKVQLRSGAVRYEFVIDHEPDATGKRKQKRYRFATRKEAQAKRAEIIATKASGTYVAPSKTTVATYLPAWLAGKRNLRAGTRRAYGDALKPVVERLGDIELQKLTKAQLDGLVDWMLTSGRRVGKVKRQGVSPRTVNIMLSVLTQALNSAMRQGMVARNVAALVEKPSHQAKTRNTWTAEQAAQFLAYVKDDRLRIGWLLSLYGLRRGEVLGLTWDDVDLEAAQPTLTVRTARVSVAGVVMDEQPKSRNSHRTLPLEPAMVEAFRAHRAAQHTESLAAGTAYERSGLVVVDELGRPYRPEWYGDRFKILARKAGLPVIPLHGARHTTGTLMHLQGVPVVVISAWLGHSSASFTMATYVHSQDDALRGAGVTLAGALGVA